MSFYTDLHLYSKVCLFPLVLGTSLTPPPLSISCTSLQRPYTQHASESHLEFFPWSVELLSIHVPSPCPHGKIRSAKRCKKLPPRFHLALVLERFALACGHTHTGFQVMASPSHRYTEPQKHLFSLIKINITYLALRDSFCFIIEVYLISDKCYTEADVTAGQWESSGGVL